MSIRHKNTLKLFFSLIKNSILFQYMKFTGKTSLPQAISLEITQNCVARCIMCNIWKTQNHIEDMPASKWLEILSSNFFTDLRELDITGGEPYLKNDLIDLLSGICRLKGSYLKRLKSVAITTNGLLTDEVLKVTQKVLPEFQKANLDMVLVCAMDSIGKDHDRIRNHKNAWEKVNLTIEGLINLRKNYGNLIIGLKTTILPLNIKDLKAIVRYADKRELFTIISPCIITSGRYLNPEKKNRFQFQPEEIEQLIQFYQEEHSGWSFHSDVLLDFLKTKKIKKPCTCGFNYFFIRSTGEMHLCPLVNESVGNIYVLDASDLFLSKSAVQFRKKVGIMEQCQTCTEPGLERYALHYEGFHYLCYMFKTGFKNFSYLHSNMGLDKLK
jgi:MoaA/NifB/PqqE/SkfB family radical SAM enzyme